MRKLFIPLLFLLVGATVSATAFQLRSEPAELVEATSTPTPPAVPTPEVIPETTPTPKNELTSSQKEQLGNLEDQIAAIEKKIDFHLETNKRIMEGVNESMKTNCVDDNPCIAPSSYQSSFDDVRLRNWEIEDLRRELNDLKSERMLILSSVGR